MYYRSGGHYPFSPYFRVTTCQERLFSVSQLSYSLFPAIVLLYGSNYSCMLSYLLISNHTRAPDKLP